MDETIDFVVSIQLLQEYVISTESKRRQYKLKLLLVLYSIAHRNKKYVHYLVSNRYNLNTESPMFYRLLFVADVELEFILAYLKVAAARR
jgi:hypothetical protein